MSETPQRPTADDRMADAPYWQSEVARALSGDEFQLHYQPKLNAREGRVASFEGLLRWDHPDAGMILPDRFIEQSEDAGCITALTLWTVDRAIEDQKALRAAGHDVRLFINLSAQLLNDAAIIAAICARARTPGGDIGIEITERSVIGDPELAFRNIRTMQHAGLSIAIDDYGSGLSSLTYLKQIEADELKIDKSFIVSLGSSHRDPLIVRSTIELAHALGMVITAEGVETLAAHALLTVMGCDMMQGWLVGRPMPVADVRPYLENFDPQSIATPADQRALRDKRLWLRA